MASLPQDPLDSQNENIPETIRSHSIQGHPLMAVIVRRAAAISADTTRGDVVARGLQSVN